MKKFIVDTNVLLRDTPKLDGLNIVLLSHVLREIEKHKESDNSERAYRARVVSRYINENYNRFTWDTRDYKVKFDENLDSDYVDNKIIQACLDNGYGLITHDLLLKHKARMYGIELLEIEESKSIQYTGYKEVVMTEKEFDDIWHSLDENKYKLLTNEYLIVKNTKGKTLDIFRWNGESLEKIQLPSKKKINPKNDLQACAIDLLYNKNIPIKFIVGTYGSGKTYLSVKAGLDFILSRSDGYSKMMVVRNPIGSGEQIGFLKGSKDDKTYDFFKPVIQHLDGGEQEADRLEASGQLIREIPWFMKGLTVDETFMLIDEAEDMNKAIIKMVGTRLGENSCAVFSGDYEQAEDKYKSNNGLAIAISELKGDPLVGIIVLNDDVRSAASKVFTRL